LEILQTLESTKKARFATHLSRAGDHAGAAEFWRRAGRHAQKNSAYREAIVAFRNALSLMKEREKEFVEVNRAIASAFFAVGDYELTRQHLGEAAAAADSGDDQVLSAEIAMQQQIDRRHIPKLARPTSLLV
jgi:tetratricopeptide (TPR) repeat protein